jgi:hypothetical protein
MLLRFGVFALPKSCVATLNFPIDRATVCRPGLGKGTRNGKQEHENAAG